MPESPPPPPEPVPPEAAKKHAPLLKVVEAVFWSFFGVRKGRDMLRDVGTINPLHVVVVGVLLGAVFVLTLIAVVQLILRS